MSKDFVCFLIDDDTDDQEIFLSVLEEISPSVRCITAINGQEGIQKLAAAEVKPDLIFLDLNMPLMNGKQFLEACSMLEGCREIPVIVLTTTSDKKSMEETLKMGACDYITKPDKISAWGSIIREKIDAYRQRRKERE